MRYRATVAYDGTHYHGFQRQVASQTTIQGELERALLEVGGVAVAVAGAGRTDRGVHARGQVISFELEWRHGSTTLKRAINANLPLDITLVDVVETDADFHPRYDARQRVYEYYIYNQSTRDPFVRLYSWHVRERLQLLPMREAASQLVGSHDFATFGQPPQGDSTIRQVYGAEWRQQDDTLVFRIEGNAFLYRMVRSIVGTLMQVGAGNWSAAEFVDAFRAADRSRAAASAPPQGLFLVSVSYEN